jgi:hypothetical protein
MREHIFGSHRQSLHSKNDGSRCVCFDRCKPTYVRTDFHMSVISYSCQPPAGESRRCHVDSGCGAALPKRANGMIQIRPNRFVSCPARRRRRIALFNQVVGRRSIARGRRRPAQPGRRHVGEPNPSCQFAAPVHITQTSGCRSMTARASPPRRRDRREPAQPHNPVEHPLWSSTAPLVSDTLACGR